MDFINLWFFAFLGLFLYFLYDWSTRPEISVKTALNYLKKDLIRLIVFYQSRYEARDQIVLIKKWIESINQDEIPKEQLKLFKNYVKEL
jgi:hypothetical protein